MKIERKKKDLPSEDDLTDEQKEHICLWTKKGRNMQKRLTILTASKTISFYLCWMPYALNCILTMCGIRVLHATNVFATLLAKSGVVINPVIYIFFNKDVSFSNYFNHFKSLKLCYSLLNRNISKYIFYKVIIHPLYSR